MSMGALLPHTDVWRGSPLVTTTNAISTGFEELDACVPAGSRPCGVLKKIFMPRQEISELQWLLPILARLSQEKRWICWIAPPYIPDADMLAGAGIDVSRILRVHPGVHQDGLWAIEQCLRSGTCSAVLAWPSLENATLLRRLQRAAEVGNTLGFIFHPQPL